MTKPIPICREKYIYGMFSGIPIIAPSQILFDRVCRQIELLGTTSFENENGDKYS